MVVEQTTWSPANDWQPAPPGQSGISAQLVLVFGSRAALQSAGIVERVQQAYPDARITGCSTAGEICDTHVFDDTVVVTAIAFRDTPLTFASVKLSEASSNEAVG